MSVGNFIKAGWVGVARGKAREGVRLGPPSECLGMGPCRAKRDLQARVLVPVGFKVKGLPFLSFCQSYSLKENSYSLYYIPGLPAHPCFSFTVSVS